MPADLVIYQAFVTRFAPGHRVLRIRDLTGGVSADMTALEVQSPGGELRKLVVRRHGPKDLEGNPDIALDEYRLLHQLCMSDIPVPRPLHLDQLCETFDVPALVLEYVIGEPLFDPTNITETVWDLAELLVHIHSIHPGRSDLKFLRSEQDRNNKRLQNPPDVLDATLQEKRIRTILEKAWPLPHRNPSMLLHGDFWPGNVLWQDQKIVAVIDWENMHSGDPMEDLSNTRLEILWAYGYDAMEAFTEHYKSMSGIDFSMMAYWDLLAALRPAGQMSNWGLEATKEQTMRNGHSIFVEQAIRAL
jgi:aminoglycoside phosphotransferase (APT) family kinase protein